VLESDVLSQHVGNNVVTQLIVANDVDKLPEQDFVVPASSTRGLVISAASDDFVVPMSTNQELVVPVMTNSVSTAHTQPETPTMEVTPLSSKNKSCLNFFFFCVPSI
jgi:hypothetical protein